MVGGSFRLSLIVYWYLWHCWNFTLTCSSINWYRPWGFVQIQPRWHNVHLITLISLRGVEEDSGVPLKGGVVTETIWRKPCNLNYGCRSLWLACVQSLLFSFSCTLSVTILLEWQINAQTLTRSVRLSFPSPPPATDVVLKAQSCFLTTSAKLN